jgi:hypothetical protein
MRLDAVSRGRVLAVVRASFAARPARALAFVTVTGHLDRPPEA